MRRLPILATVLVLLAVAAMIALGVWQLDRREEKRAALALYAANMHLPAIDLAGQSDDATLLFRRARATCEMVAGWERQGGRSTSGAHGWRQIALCRTPDKALLRIDVGVARDPGFRPRWTGGAVAGTLTRAPDHRPLVAAILNPGPQPLLLVSTAAAPGLEPSAPPDLSSVPNNHLAYAVQWFLFAAVALIIYALALRLRARGARQMKPPQANPERFNHRLIPPRK
jgi:surfeit locus 1 family protein